MSEDYLAQQPTAIWNSARGVWEKPMASLLCEHWELFSEVWPTSGMMLGGRAYALPMQAHHTTDSEFSLLPTAKARDAQAEGYEAGLRRSQPQVGTIVKGLVDGDERITGLMPTPTTRDHKDGQAEHERNGVVQTDTVARAVFSSGEVLLPTTRTSMKNGATAKEVAEGNPKSRIEAEVLLGDVSWGKFEPAIRRWEKVLGRPAPAPTKPDGKDGAHRLSSKFTEWMMGLPDNWITGHGLSRNDELKMAGNGVVPQQAELALRILLDGVTFEPVGGQVNLPTPTVSDIFTDSLRSTQQKEGSMHSVTLPQAVKMIDTHLADTIERARPQITNDLAL